MSEARFCPHTFLTPCLSLTPPLPGCPTRACACAWTRDYNSRSSPAAPGRVHCTLVKQAERPSDALLCVLLKVLGIQYVRAWSLAAVVPFLPSARTKYCIHGASVRLCSHNFPIFLFAFPGSGRCHPQPVPVSRAESI